MDGWTGGRVDGWMGGRVDGWTGGRMDGWMDYFAALSVTCRYVRMEGDE